MKTVGIHVRAVALVKRRTQWPPFRPCPPASHQAALVHWVGLRISACRLPPSLPRSPSAHASGIPPYLHPFRSSCSQPSNSSLASPFLYLHLAHRSCTCCAPDEAFQRKAKWCSQVPNARRYCTCTASSGNVSPATADDDVPDVHRLCPSTMIIQTWHPCGLTGLDKHP